MKNDMQRAVDSVLSGLMTTPEMREQLILTAMEDSKRLHLGHGARVAESCPRKRTEGVSPANRVKHRLNFSLSFGLPHMIVAAIVVIVVMIAPLFVPGQREYFKTWQSEDGEHYMIEGIGEEKNNQVAEANDMPTERGMFQCETLEEASRHYGTTIPVFTWVPDGWVPKQYTVGLLEHSRSNTVTYQRGEEEFISYTVFECYEGEAYMAVEQDEEGEYYTLSNGQQIYITYNYDRYSVAWTEGNKQFLFSGDFTIEEAIRMAESVKTP